ncbi:MAG: IS1634 family transposase [bacterium]|nr:IS1634 family transposase [bacterium]
MRTSPAVRSAGILFDDIDLRTRHLGHLPLVRALIAKLGVDQAVNEVLPKDPRSRVSDADCVAAMILNILSGRCALYSMPEFFEHTDTDIVLGSHCPPDALNDARLAAALDHLFDAGTDYVLGRVVQAYLGRHDAPADYSVFIDTTSIALHGAYDLLPAQGAPTVRRGFSKDHRPDLKQLVFGLSLHGAVGIPLTCSSLDGNTADKKANQWNIGQLASLLPEQDEVTLVGDSKLVDAELFGQLLDEGFHFVSLVPLTYAVRTQLVQSIRDHDAQLPELARTPGRRRAEPDSLYRGRSFRRDMDVVDPHTGERRTEEMTLLVVRSDSQAVGFDNALDKRFIQEERRFMTAVKKANKRKFKCRDDAETARRAALGTLVFQSVDLDIEAIEVTEKRRGPGRPKKGETPPTHTEYRLVYDQLAPDEASIDKARFHAAHFVLVTDRSDWSDERILQEYRHQSMIEGHCGYADPVVMRSETCSVEVEPLLSRRPAPHHYRVVNEAIRASGALKRPRRSCGGNMASTASSFSVGSIRR